MVTATSNKLLPILAGSVMLMLVFVTLKSCNSESDGELVMESVPQAPNPDADTPADTIKTLTANVAAMTAEVKALRQDNTGLRSENRELLASRTQIEDNVTTRVTRKLLSREKNQSARYRKDSGVLSSLTARVDALSQSLTKINLPSKNSDIPVGLGFDALRSNSVDSLIWVKPMEIDESDASAINGKRLLNKTRQSADKLAVLSKAQSSKLNQKIKPIEPVYTIPRNATLIGSTVMTALVGRVPVGGKVRDPMPFKVITGVDNLAANGLTIPGVQGMVWSGTAIGDWTLSCITGRLDSVTFVFDDGTIQTLSSNDRKGKRGNTNKPLGWISDQQGIPCISGARKTNAPAFLSQRIGVMAIQAAADAAAAAETTSVIGNTSGISNSVTGDVGNYVLGKTLSGGSKEVGKWLMERQSQSFDAIFVPAGTRIAIHVDRELPIDLDTTGRKLSYEKSIDPYTRTRLD
ncbi:MAG TPA: TIGR03752 family integrating conjugative element protein [Gammaproteobacteria bacterium]|nr:TIGR03752 family integrating conjugative element protein [Gammaproteobacteria bacterium]